MKIQIFILNILISNYTKKYILNNMKMLSGFFFDFITYRKLNEFLSASQLQQVGEWSDYHMQQQQ